MTAHQPEPVARYWRVHFSGDRYDDYVSIDCGKPVTEKCAVDLAHAAYATQHRGSVTTAIAEARP
jgi:hypothetical protein